MAESQITTTLEQVDGIQVVHVAGPLDSMTHESFKNFLEPLVSQPRTRVVLDCAKLTYVNSKGLALLGRFQRMSMQNLSFLGIAGLNKYITKTIVLLGLSKLVKLYPTLDEAMEAARMLA
ncbi:MAG: STAS domain-containing protein [Kiritimatiellae bacterium]|nr:STAS domain-containing protein [Kiritimatiellia bacterium]MBQ9344920.1 STAS domain-containing protein [Kiritimatiellia bacterium]